MSVSVRAISILSAENAFHGRNLLGLRRRIADNKMSLKAYAVYSDAAGVQVFNAGL
jgi:hypothetical protein